MCLISSVTMTKNVISIFITHTYFNQSIYIDGVAVNTPKRLYKILFSDVI